MIQTKKLKTKIITVATILFILILATTTLAMPANSKTIVKNERSELLSYFSNEVEDYDDWELICALHGAGYEFDEDFFINLNWNSDYIPTDSTPSFYGSRVLALMAMGKNPGNIWGRDLIDELKNKQKSNGSFGTITDTVYSMLALNAYGLEYDHNGALDFMLSTQNEDGGFGFMEGTSDLDTTGTVLYALSYYLGSPAVDYAVDKAKEYIKSNQISTAGFMAWGEENSNSTSKIISGLSAIGEDIFSEYWTVNSNTMLDALLSFKTDKGMYKWLKDDDEYSYYSTKQILIAYNDLLGGNTFKNISNNVEHINFTLRIEGINTTILDKNISATKIGSDLKLEDALIQALKENKMDYEIESDSSMGSYIVSLNEIENSSFGGYDGWMYLLNGVSGSGISTDTISDSDTVLIYYGSFAPDTLVPEIEVLNQKIYPNEDIHIKVSSRYYDWSKETTVETVIENATITLGENEYYTNEDGIAVIDSGLDSPGKYSFSVSKNRKDSYPAIVRKNDLILNVTEAPNMNMELDIRIEGIEETIINGSFEYIYKANEEPLLENALKYILESQNIEYSTQTSSFGSYITSIANESTGTFGGYDGWMYLINGSSGMGISVDSLNNGDKILIYYGDMAPATVIPEVTITPNVIDLGDEITITVESTYEEYDENWNSQTVTNSIEGATVEYYGNKYLTNSNGQVSFKTVASAIDSALYIKVYKENQGSVPSLVRTDKIYLPLNLNIEDKFIDNDLISNWAVYGVYKAKELGIIEGYQNKYNPKETLTRAQIVKMFVELMGLEIGNEYSSDFVDVNEDDWYAKYISTAVDANIIKGDGHGNFMPKKSITKQELAVIISNAIKLSTNEEDFITLDDNIDTWAQDAVNLVCTNGIMEIENGFFNPKKTVSREYAAKLMSILAEKYLSVTIQ